MTLLDDQLDTYAAGVLAVAQAEGKADAVSDEVFRFSRALESSNEMRMALTDQRIDASRRQQIVEDLLGGKADPTTVGIVSMVVSSGHAGELGKLADRLVARAATASGKKVAYVRTAVPLSDDQRSRLATALAAKSGGEVDLKITVDPKVVGGIVTRIGDTVIDGSVRSRLIQLREAF